MKKLTWISLAVVVALAGGGGAWWWSQRDANAGVQYRTGKLERGALSAAVSATGTVNPVSLVTVGTQVSGQIKDIFVDFNSEVKAGQLLALIDPETFEYRLRSAQADVDAARATVLTAQASIASSRAGVSRAQVDLDEAQRDHERKLSLVEKQFIAQSEADKARALVNTTAEQLKAAQAQLGVTQAQAQSATASVAQREAALAQARVDVSRTRITSPVNGIVIKRAIEKGQTVASSLQSPELFVIAQNLQDMQVDASIDEADVGRIRNGLKASFTVDAFPGQTFEGDVKQVRKAAQTVANVVTYVAVVGFNNTSGRLLPGMTANVRLVTDQRESVLKVPNAALRVRIAGVEPAAATGGGAPSAVPASGGATSGSAAGFTWLSQAQAQPSGPPPGAPGGGPGGGLAALRDRLTAELQLTAEQQAQFDAIGAALRPRFMAVRDLPQEQRAAAREAVSADMRKQIAAMLTPAQQARYTQWQAQNGVPGAAASVPSAAHSVANSKDAKSAAVKKGTQSAPSTATAAAAAVAVAPAAASAPAGSGGGSAAGPGPGGTGGSGPLAEFRRRLVAEVGVTPDQLEKVDALYADARPRFMALRELPEAERGKARERLSGDIRARINELLTPEQKPRYAALQAEIGARQTTRGRIYLLGDDGKPRAVNVRLGISDGSSTELLISPNSPEAASLKEGALVVTGVSGGSAAKPAGSTPAAGPRPMF